MNYCDLSIEKVIENSEDYVLTLISKASILEENDIISYIAEMKNCEVEDITEQDCVEFLKRSPKVIQHFFKCHRFFVKKIEIISYNARIFLKRALKMQMSML